jgi:cyclophilin family peptidyl-prolyl cis-trans isomerase
VGTAKRERQKAGRQSRREEAAVVVKKQQKRKQLRYYGTFVAIALVIIGFFWIRGALRDDDTSTTATTGASGATASGAVTTTTVVTSYGTLACPPTDGSGERKSAFDEKSGGFKQCIDLAKTYTATVKATVADTTYDIVVDLDAKKAPVTVNNFVSLARSKFYDAVPCHRIIPAFVAQCGDPKGDGSGGPGYKFGDELPQAGEYQIGSLAMANSGPNTNGSQFFIITGKDGAALPPNYTLFGKVRAGQDATIAALDAAGNPDKSKNGVPPAKAVGLLSVTIAES